MAVLKRCGREDGWEGEGEEEREKDYEHVWCGANTEDLIDFFYEYSHSDSLSDEYTR